MAAVTPRPAAVRHVQFNQEALVPLARDAVARVRDGEAGWQRPGDFRKPGAVAHVPVLEEPGAPRGDPAAARAGQVRHRYAHLHAYLPSCMVDSLKLQCRHDL